MARCSFSIPFTIAPEALIDKARSAIQGQGGNFSAENSRGSFAVQLMGTISGTFQIVGQEMQVEINEKPMFIGCGQIESFMRSQFAK